MTAAPATVTPPAAPRPGFGDIRHASVARSVAVPHERVRRPRTKGAGSVAGAARLASWAANGSPVISKACRTCSVTPGLTRGPWCDVAASAAGELFGERRAMDPGSPLRVACPGHDPGAGMTVGYQVDLPTELRMNVANITGTPHHAPMPAHAYILTNQTRGTLYTGVTTNLPQRIWQHREGVLPGFTSWYGCRRLVWHAGFADVRDAIAEEHRIKRWRRSWKVALIERENPDWADLWPTLGPIAPTEPLRPRTTCRTVADPISAPPRQRPPVPSPRT